MAADFITRILLDDKKFNDTLEKVRKGLDITGSVTNGFTSSLKGMAGQIAAAAGAYEVMNTAVNSNSISQENWNDILGTTKETVDSFFTSLASGDWSIWENGVENAINLSKKYTQALRNMRMAILVGDVRLSQQEKDLNLYENQATDENASKADREAAFVKFKAMGNDTIAYIDNLSDYVNNKLKEILEGKHINADKNVRDMIFKYLDPSTEGSKLLQEYSNLYQEITNAKIWSKSIATNKYEIESKSRAAEKLPKLKKSMAELVAMYPELEQAYNLKLNFGTQEELDQLFDIIDRIVGYEDRLESAKRQIRDVAKDFDSSGKLIASSTSGGGSKKNNPLIPEGSMADLENQLKAAREKYMNATTYEVRVAAQKTIDELEAKKINMQAVIRATIVRANGGAGSKPIERKSSNLAGMADMSGLTGKIEVPQFEEATETATDFNTILQTVAGTISTLSSSFDGGASSVLSYFANIISGSAQAAAAIAALIPVKKAEANANMEAAVSGAAASQAAIPFVGPAMAIAAVLSLLAAMTAIPKFATGGIVGGSSFVGDKLLARVNSGEMILNKQQQSSLYGMVNNQSGVVIGFDKVRGSDIYLSLRNYMKETGKKL